MAAGSKINDINNDSRNNKVLMGMLVLSLFCNGYFFLRSEGEPVVIGVSGRYYPLPDYPPPLPDDISPEVRQQILKAYDDAKARERASVTRNRETKLKKSEDTREK